MSPITAGVTYTQTPLVQLAWLTDRPSLFPRRPA